MITRTVFEEVRMSDTKSVKCAGCGKRLKRSKTVCQTLNPFNKLADGTVKDRWAIRAELNDELNRWKDLPEWCGSCPE